VRAVPASGGRDTGKRMIEVIWFLLVCTVVQIGVLRLWFDSYLFHPVQERLPKLEAMDFPWNWIGYMLQCWQCFGVWVGCGVVFLMTYLPRSPVTSRNPLILLCLGIAVGLLSELFEYFVLSRMPLRDFNRKEKEEDDSL